MAIFVVSITVLLLMVGCNSDPAPNAILTPIVASTQTPTVTQPKGLSKLNKAQLEEAHSKWASKNIQAYEIDVHEVVYGGWVNEDTLYKLRIRKDQIELVSANSAYESRTSSSLWVDRSKSYSIENQFAKLNDILNAKDSKPLFEVDYAVSFDETYGYPTRIISVPNVDDGNTIEASISNLVILDSK